MNKKSGYNKYICIVSVNSHTDNTFVCKKSSITAWKQQKNKWLGFCLKTEKLNLVPRKYITQTALNGVDYVNT